MTRAHVGAVPFDVLSLDDAIALVLAQAQRLADAQQSGSTTPRGVAVHFCNAYHVALASSDPELAQLLDAGDLVLCDGVPVAWAGRRAYPDLAHRWERVYGPDVMRGVLARSTPEGPAHYLLGSTPETLAALTEQIAREYPKARIVGTDAPPFHAPTDAELAARDERIRASGATIVWVGLGTPKQDVEVQRLVASLPVVAMAVGAAFDFLAGTKAQAPVWMQRSGLEWAFRLASEPTRLGRRYVWGNSVFLREAAGTLRAPAAVTASPISSARD